MLNLNFLAIFFWSKSNGHSVPQTNHAAISEQHDEQSAMSKEHFCPLRLRDVL